MTPIEQKIELQALYQLLYSVTPIHSREHILLAIDKALMILDHIMKETSHDTDI